MAESGFDLEGNLTPVARVNDIEFNQAFLKFVQRHGRI
jgi:hypothetical protein